jgi:short-subunit dehydrogenase
MTDTTPAGARPLALVTGASRGIGYELARQFAENGFDLVVNSEDDGLQAAADRLRGTGADVRTARSDLRDRRGVEELYAAITGGGRPVDAVALNAGVGLGGPFVDNDLDAELSIIDLNITSTVHLAKLLLRDMVRRGSGRVLITSSIAATMPGTYQAVYNASKSFLQSFAQALQSELSSTGVTVTSLMPGPTETDFFRRAEMLDTPVGQSSKDDPTEVARQGFRALMAGRDKLVAGSLQTKASGVASDVLPDAVKAALHKKMAKPKST